MFQLKDITVTFTNNEGKEVKAVDHVNLTIQEGEIFGIIGYSGAGKSTLLRTINLLQEPTSGEVILDGQIMTQLNPKELRAARKKIGMVFQHFNLMDSRTVEGNVAFPLKGSGLTQKEIKDKVNKLLSWVGLEDKAGAYPSQLSGGQKQRVGIARALANDPKILLCDEATSALDPKTTQDILSLLKDINQQTGITIVIITHEMSVIKDICDRVAVMDQGKVVEAGDVYQVFSKPKEAITQTFINSASPVEKGIQDTLSQVDQLGIPSNAKVLKIHFLGERVSEPMIIELFKTFQVTSSILFAHVEHIQHQALGTLLIALKGEDDQVERAIHYLSEEGFEPDIYPIEQGGMKNEPTREVISECD